MEDMTIRSFRRQFDRGRARRMTDYLRTLDSWSAFYPEERIFAGFLEDIHFFPEETLRSLYRFLGIDPSAARGDHTEDPSRLRERDADEACHLPGPLPRKRQSIWRSASGATPRSGASAQSNWPRDRRKRERPGK